MGKTGNARKNKSLAIPKQGTLCPGAVDAIQKQEAQAGFGKSIITFSSKGNVRHYPTKKIF